MMSEVPAARDALMSFLLSVVLIDDQADFDTNADQAGGSGCHGLNAKAIVDSFADIGLVCGVLKPRSGEEGVIERVRSAARRSDVVILDWMLRDGDEDGELAREILRTLLEDDDAQHMLRFFVIYTGTPQLRSIAKRCSDLLKSLGDEFLVDDKDEFTLRRGPVTLSVFAKETVPESGDESLDERRCKFGSLPTKLLEDYRKNTPGLVESAALQAVAQIRKRTHLLLARFASDVDAAYLWHRAMQSNQEDAAAQIVEILGAEMTDIIDSAFVRDEVSSVAGLRWVELHAALLTRAGQFDSKKLASLEEIKQVVEVGAEAATLNGVKLKAFTDDGVKLQFPAFADTYINMENSHERFAMLMTLRVVEKKPFLRSGVIVQVDADYWLCVQPLCDSVRLTKRKEEQIRFPFLRLSETGQENKNRFNIVIPLDDGRRVRRLIPYKPDQLVNLEFPTVDDTVNPVTEGHQQVFHAIGAVSAFYRATLRPMKAVSVVTLLASTLSRTGINDPEWLRGSAK